MALTAPQLEIVREIVGYKSYSTIELLCTEFLINADMEAAMVADTVLWATVKNEHLKLKGGELGVDLDESRDRRAIRKRVLERLGEDAPSTGGIFNIAVGTGYQDACDT